MKKIKKLLSIISIAYNEKMVERCWFLLTQANMDHIREYKKRQSIVECVFNKHLDDIDAARREALRSVAKLN